MHEILPLLPGPSRFLGNEVNSVHKDPDRVKVRVALAFPDLYEVGMSYLGQKILYSQVNAHPDFWAERVFAPPVEAAEIMRRKNVPLATLESDTPLKSLDVLAFSLTHELCYTNVLYMLDLAGIDLQAHQRGQGDPLVMAGGGCTFNAEPLAEFLDVMVLGDGEEVLPRILEAWSQGGKSGKDRNAVIKSLADIDGVYVPSLFSISGRGRVSPKGQARSQVRRTAVPDLNTFAGTSDQVVPYAKPVHDRLTLEVARGCTRGCRFCQAGMIYRPVRERTPRNVGCALQSGVAATGFEEISFLSLSTGDFSALNELFNVGMDLCRANQISISLPSLRAGTVSSEMFAAMAALKRTGLTIAPEAGTQRLRDVINKGICERDILEHAARAFDFGWQSVKLYFMIGLPTETREDLDGILDLCLKILDQAGSKAKRTRLTVAISPFVPKPHTPFQWERQLSLHEVEDRLVHLKNIFRSHRRIQLKWHHSHMSLLEGVFSRGGRELAPIVRRAYEAGQVFTSWTDHLDLKAWLDILQANGLSADEYLRQRTLDEPLPWDHLHCGVRRKYLEIERARAFQGKTTADCRYGPCRQCGACPPEAARISRQAPKADLLMPRINKKEFTRDAPLEIATTMVADLSAKVCRYRLWYEKLGLSVYLSQLELQRLFERAMRRAGLPLSFSQGFSPSPRMSFGRALPVGVGSRAEWINVFFRELVAPDAVANALEAQLPSGMRLLRVELLDVKKHQPQALAEDYTLTVFSGSLKRGIHEVWTAFDSSKSWVVPMAGKKGVLREKDIRPYVLESSFPGPGIVSMLLDWRENYVSPLRLVLAACPGLELGDFNLVKEQQWMESNLHWRLSAMCSIDRCE